MKGFTAQQLPDAALAKIPVLKCHFYQPPDAEPYSGWRQGKSCHPAGSTLRQTGRITHIRQLPFSGLSSVFSLQSHLKCLCIYRASARSFLSLAFSFSSDFRCLTSGTSILQVVNKNWPSR